MGEEDGAAEVVVVLQFAIGQGQFFKHCQVEGVALGGAIQADKEDVALLFGGDIAGCHWFFLCNYTVYGGAMHCPTGLGWCGF
jgi:hypothetical protein